MDNNIRSKQGLRGVHGVQGPTATFILPKHYALCSRWLGIWRYTSFLEWGRLKALETKQYRRKAAERWKRPGARTLGKQWGGWGPEPGILPTIKTAGPIGSVERDQIQTDVWKRKMERLTHINSDSLYHVTLILEHSEASNAKCDLGITLAVQLMCGSPSGLSPITCKVVYTMNKHPSTSINRLTFLGCNWNTTHAGLDILHPRMPTSSCDQGEGKNSDLLDSSWLGCMADPQNNQK